jgi:hypothetical protein
MTGTRPVTPPPQPPLLFGLIRLDSHSGAISIEMLAAGGTLPGRGWIHRVAITATHHLVGLGSFGRGQVGAAHEAGNVGEGLLLMAFLTRHSERSGAAIAVEFRTALWTGKNRNN